MSRPTLNKRLWEVTSFAQCEGFIAEFADGDGCPPIRVRVIGYGTVRAYYDHGDFYFTQAACVDDGMGGVMPANKVTGFIRVVHRDDLEVEGALLAFMTWFERMVADPPAYLTEADITVQCKHLRLFAKSRGVVPEPADTGNEGN